MNMELLRDNWALAFAAGVAILLVLFALARLLADSAAARLRQAGKRLAAERGRLRKAEAAVERAGCHVSALKKRAETVKPRLLQEAVGKAADAEALARIARDNVMIAEQRLRQVIHEEFAPAKQARLRAKYLPETPPDKRPFSF
ncbi:MAG TPA: hypothetical protein VFG91_07395 [Woeseiaceae bacterium]|nr:hypothetical protein [Woeseiaceae bacterium]